MLHIADPSSGVASIVLGIQLIRRGFSHFFFYQRTEEQIEAEFAGENKGVIRKYSRTPFRCKIDSTAVKIYTTEPLEAFYTVLDHCLQLFPGAPQHVSLGHVEERLDDVVLQVLDMYKVGACESIALPAGCVISDTLLKHMMGMESLKGLYQNSAVVREFKYYKV